MVLGYSLEKSTIWESVAVNAYLAALNDPAMALEIRKRGPTTLEAVHRDSLLLEGYQKASQAGQPQEKPKRHDQARSAKTNENSGNNHQCQRNQQQEGHQVVQQQQQTSLQQQLQQEQQQQQMQQQLVQQQQMQIESMKSSMTVSLPFGSMTGPVAATAPIYPVANNGPKRS